MIMSRNKTLSAALALLVLVGAGIGAWYWLGSKSASRWEPNFQAEAGSKPTAVVALPAKRNFGYRTGNLVEPVVDIHCPADWQPEVASISVAGDFTLVGSSFESEALPDGSTRLRYRLTLQTLEPKQHWTFAPVLKFKHVDKFEAVEFDAVEIAGSRTFDDRPKSPLQQPDTHFEQGYHGIITVSFLALGSGGILLFTILLFRSLKRTFVPPTFRKPKPKDPRQRMEDAFRALFLGDWYSLEVMQELALSIREFYGVQMKLASTLVESKLSREQIIGEILQLVEGPFLRTREFEPDSDVAKLRGLHRQLAAADGVTLAEPKKQVKVEPWPQDEEPVVVQCTEEELERIAMEALADTDGA